MKWPWNKEPKEEKTLLKNVEPKPITSQLVTELMGTGYSEEKAKRLVETNTKTDLELFIRLHHSINKQRIELGITEEEFAVICQIPNADVRHKVTEYLAKIHAGGTHRYSEKGYSLNDLLKNPDKLIKLAENPELDSALSNTEQTKGDSQ